MRRIYEWHRWPTVVLALALAATSIPAAAKRAAKLNVVASTSDLAALAAEVGGTQIEVDSLVRGNQDPHFVEAKPSYLLKLRRADLLLVVGLELESGWLTRPHHMPSLVSQSGNSRIQPGASGYFDASQYAEILEVPNQPLTPSIQPLGNPHYLLDPENGRRVAQALANKMSEMRPNDAAYFQRRFREFGVRLSNAEKAWNEEMQPYHGKRVVAYSRTWSNFLKYFQLVSVGELEPQLGIPPSPSHTAEIIRLMKNENVKVILTEPYFEASTTTAIARETGAQVVALASSVGEEKGVDDYFQLFDFNIWLLTTAFRPTLNESFGTESDRDFLVLMLKGSARVEAIAQPCAGKHVREDLKTLCRQIIGVRTQEDQILQGWFSNWFQMSAPSRDQSTVSPELTSADGNQFEIAFLELMTQQDWEELRTDHACMVTGSRQALRNLCGMLARARTVEIQLMRTQLCLWDDHCGPQDNHKDKPPFVRTLTFEPAIVGVYGQWLSSDLSDRAPFLGF